MIRKFSPVSAGSVDNLPGVVDQLQENLLTTLDGITRNPFLDGNLIANISLVSGQDNFVGHGLGVAYRGFWVISPSAASHVYLSTTSNAFKNKHIILKCSANVNISLWVF